ncbi:putative E3 ubiquitin-protein ligase [Ascosphaera pollenicola]|nr:putative E3 ubiquitin-protein ligase [Ascosphaera pollenicola]
MVIPKTMRALKYEKPHQHSVVEVPVPQVKGDEILVKIKASGVCGTDLHIDKGEFIAQFPLIPGHEAVGEIAAVGPEVTQFKVGDRVVCDNSELCGECFFCRRGEELMCESFNAHGVTLPGAFAEYCAYQEGKVYRIENLDWVDATLIEPASCAAHGVDIINAHMNSEILIFGAGPTGLVLSQMLKLNGGVKVTIAAPEGLKMSLAKELDAADEYVELSRKDSQPQMEQIKKDHPHGFDFVIEATGSARMLEDSINYVRRGGTLVTYAVYDNDAVVSWKPTKIFGDEIKITGCFSEVHKFPAAINYLDSGKVKVHGIVNKTFKLDQWEECLEAIRNKSAIKAAIVFD